MDELLVVLVVVGGVRTVLLDELLIKGELLVVEELPALEEVLDELLELGMLGLDEVELAGVVGFVLGVTVAVTGVQGFVGLTDAHEQRALAAFRTAPTLIPQPPITQLRASD